MARDHEMQEAQQARAYDWYVPAEGWTGAEGQWCGWVAIDRPFEECRTHTEPDAEGHFALGWRAPDMERG